ncbi:VIT1/CCC1 transporter family protein [bacterium]|nr:VIT1/CCC1 transporter family protein [bacterium]
MNSRHLRGFVDGSLSTLGIVIGASSASSEIIMAAGIGGAFANGISNFLGAYSAAGVEEYAELREQERAMVTRDLTGSVLDRAIARRTAMAGLSDGVATIFGGALPIIPYLFLSTTQATVASAAIVMGATGVIGLYFGRISKRDIWLSAVKMALMAAVIAVAVFLVEQAIVPSDAG